MNNYMVQLDMMMSNIPQMTGSFANLGTQVVQGWNTEDTTFWLAKKDFMNAFRATDYEWIAEEGQLFLSQLLKFKAPETFKDVIFVGGR